MKLPVYTEELIAELDKAYPRPLYHYTNDMNEFLMKSGERRLIETLITKLKQQKEEDTFNVL